VGVGAVGLQAHPAAGENAVDETMELLDKVLQRENMLRALARVKQNKGAAGVDGMTIDELDAHLREHWPRIREEVLSGAYQPQAVRRVDIPKPCGGGVRTLGIPTVLDRLLQQALAQELTLIFDPTFSDGSFGFRPNRGAHQAVERARALMASGRGWVVDLDLEKFLDHASWSSLRGLTRRTAPFWRRWNFWRVEGRSGKRYSPVSASRSAWILPLRIMCHIRGPSRRGP